MDIDGLGLCFRSGRFCCLCVGFQGPNDTSIMAPVLLRSWDPLSSGDLEQANFVYLGDGRLLEVSVHMVPRSALAWFGGPKNTVLGLPDIIAKSPPVTALVLFFFCSFCSETLLSFTEAPVGS